MTKTDYLIELLLEAALIMPSPQCSTPMYCFTRHGRNCRVTRWEEITKRIYDAREALEATKPKL